MKLEQIIEARLAKATKWKPKTITYQWLEINDPQKVTHWKPSRRQDYQQFIGWVQRHEDELNRIYKDFVHGWDEFKEETQPRKVYFGAEGEFEWEHDWDLNDFNPHDQFSNTKAFKQLYNADDFNDDWFEDVIDQMSYNIMQS